MLAHELGHVNNRDILISSVAATLAGAITMLASMGRWAMIFGGYGGRDRDRGGGGGLAGLFMLIVAPIAATMIQLAVSRSREYQADATGAHFTGNPYALASALQKLDAYSRRVPMQATPVDRAPVHHSAVAGNELRQPVLDPSPDREAHRAADGKARGVYAVSCRAIELLAHELNQPRGFRDYMIAEYCNVAVPVMAFSRIVVSSEAHELVSSIAQACDVRNSTTRRNR